MNITQNRCIFIEDYFVFDVTILKVAKRMALRA